MSNNNKKKYSVHVHFDGTPSPEFIEAFSRMLDVAAEHADNIIKNEETLASEKSFCQCEQPAKIKGENKCWRCKLPFKEFSK